MRQWWRLAPRCRCIRWRCRRGTSTRGGRAHLASRRHTQRVCLSWQSSLGCANRTNGFRRARGGWQCLRGRIVGCGRWELACSPPVGLEGPVTQLGSGSSGGEGFGRTGAEPDASPARYPLGAPVVFGGVCWREGGGISLVSMIVMTPTYISLAIDERWEAVAITARRAFNALR